ncbi:MAG TPA: hypothetical protein VFE16_04730 [Candidatus Cybelea sp.]|nr:hypothetical protein [Candidatus Cybelea sp.]
MSLLAMAITFGPYFAIVASRRLPEASLPNLNLLGLFAAAALAQVLVLGAGRLYLGRTSPDDARTPPDERDSAIVRRSMSAAYYVLIAGIIVVGCVMPFSFSGWAIVNAALATIVTAELVHYGVVVCSYRRQT